jgi:hypothetical protein
MEEIRTRRVMVRFSPGKGAPPDEVRFTPKELAAVHEARQRLGYAGISTFIRELAVGGATAQAGGPGFPDRDLVMGAAAQVSLPLGKWLHLVVLGGIGFSPLESHLTKARMVVWNRSRRKGKQ